MGIAPSVEDEPLAPPPGQSRIEPGEFLQSQVDLSGEASKETQVPGVDEIPTRPVENPPDVETQQQQSPPAPLEDEDPVYDLYELGAVDYEPSVHQGA
jgi:hypothetical protein